jgi:putative oxidoreductase
MRNKIFPTDSSRTTIIIRILVGAVFLSEGIQKVLFPDLRGPGRFEGMGFPEPAFFPYFVAVFEIASGFLMLIGLLTRPAAIAMILNMLVAITVTKIPIALGESLGPFEPRDLKIYGFWSMAHEIRNDWSMLLGSLFLLIKGGGRWSVDRTLTNKALP